MKKIWVKRLSNSSYFSESFILNEKQAFENLGLHYLSPTEDYPPEDSTQIWISNTITKLPSNYPKNLKLIIHPNSGYENLLPEAENFKEPIILGNPIRANAVSEMILSILFYEFTKLTPFEDWQKGRSWNRSLLRDQKILLIGHGYIGKKIRASLMSLNVSVFVSDPYQDLSLLQQQASEKYDVLILACSLNQKNRYLVDEHFLKQMTPSSLIINTARGGLIHEGDLRNFLKNNPNARAYLDVFEKEPQDYSLWNETPNAFLFPHKAGVSKMLEEDMINFSVRVTKHFLDSKLEVFKSLFLSEQKKGDQWI